MGAITQDVPSTSTDRGQLRAVIELLLSSELARTSTVPLHHAPEALARSPAKLEILVNSMLVFLERGVAQVTVQDLLDAAAISRRTFYKYFRNKVDVLESLYKLAVDIMVLRYKSDVGNARTLGEVADCMADVFFGYHRDLAPVIRMMQEEAIRTDSPLAPYRKEAMRKVVVLVNQEIRRIAGREIDPLVIQSLMWAMEGMSIEYLRGDAESVTGIGHARRVVAGIAEAALLKAIDEGI